MGTRGGERRFFDGEYRSANSIWEANLGLYAPTALENL
jgi:hypothetical protein